MAHAINSAPRLQAYDRGPAMGFGSRRKGAQVVAAIWPPDGTRFAGYVERDGALISRETLDGVAAAVEFLERDGT